MKFRTSADLAEICGIHAGDGYLRNDGKRIELDVSGNLEEKDYYTEHVAPLFASCFGIEISPREFPSRKTFGFVIRDKAIVSFMHSLGFTYGSKTYGIRIPEFIKTNTEFSARFLKGIFDTDGCFTLDKRRGKYPEFQLKNPTYPRIMLTTVSKNLARDMVNALNKLSIRNSLQRYKPKNPREGLRYIVWVVGKNEVSKWLKIIRSKNNSKLSRYKIFKAFGFCPSKTSYKERLSMLSKGSVAQLG